MFIDVKDAAKGGLDTLRKAIAVGHAVDVGNKMEAVAQKLEAKHAAKESQRAARRPAAASRSPGAAAKGGGGGGLALPPPWEIESFEYLEATFKEMSAKLAPFTQALTMGQSVPEDVAALSAQRNKVTKALKALQSSLASLEDAKAYLGRLTDSAEQMKRHAFACRDARDAQNGKAALRVYKILDGERAKLAAELAAA